MTKRHLAAIVDCHLVREPQTDRQYDRKREQHSCYLRVHPLMHLILPSPFSPEGINIAQQLPQSALQLALAQLLFSTKYRVVA